MPPDFIPLDAPASVTSTLSAPATTAAALHPFIVALPPNQLEVYMKIKDIPPAKVAILSLDSLRSHNPGWHASVDRALTQTGLRALTTYGSTFPLVSLQEFWSSFEWMNQRPHRLLKCIRFRLGGVQYEKTLDEFALLLDADATTVDASLGFEEMSTVAQAPYPDIWRFISGESEAKPENGTVVRKDATTSLWRSSFSSVPLRNSPEFTRDGGSPASSISVQLPKSVLLLFLAGPSSLA